MRLSLPVSLLTSLVLCHANKNNVVHDERQQYRNLWEQDDSAAIPYPRVYTANVPGPKSFRQSKLVSSVDLLNIMSCHVQDQTVLDKDGQPDKWCQIAFLVQSDEELDDLYNIMIDNQEEDILVNLQLDLDETDKFTQEEQGHYGVTLAARNDNPDGGDDDNNNNDNADDNDESENTIVGHQCFRNLQGSFEMMYDLVEKANNIPSLSVTIEDIGDSYLKTQNPNEGYDILALKITGNGTHGAPPSQNKGLLFIMTGIHPREYSPPELAMRFAEGLVNVYGHDPDATSMLDHTEIHFVIQTNPDGRALAETTQKMRRKNLNLSDAPFWCQGSNSGGVDLNRNFPFRWGYQNQGSSSSPCQETYRGAYPASEPETQAIIGYVTRIFPQSQQRSVEEAELLIDVPRPELTTRGIFTDIHSFGEIIIWPWGHEERATPNKEGYNALINKLQYHNGYAPSGPFQDFSYPASGATDDFAYGVLGAAGFTFELGTRFHQDCDYFDRYIINQNLQALMYAAKVSFAPYAMTKGPDVTKATIIPRSITLPTQDVEMNDDVLEEVILIEAFASDNALAAYNDIPTTQQQISEIRAYINSHPYDNFDDDTSYRTLQVSNNNPNGSLSISLRELLQIENIESLVASRNAIHLQAIDSDGYAGPITALWFDVIDSNNNNNDSDDQDNQQPPPPPPPPIDDNDQDEVSDQPDLSVCQDTDETFMVEITGQHESCEWLHNNMRRFGWLCKFTQVASACPFTCDKCQFFPRTSE